MLIEQPYVDFLQFSLDDHEELPANAKNIDWKRMLIWAEQQAIVGVIFNGIQKADKNLSIPANILLQWIGYANLIEKRNLFLNKRCVELTDYLKQYGFDTCILKGQGNALMYPNPLLRTPGDIDVWMISGSRFKVHGEGLKIREIIRLAREKNPKGKACYHHVDFGEFNGVEVEVHYRPTFMNNLVANKRLQRWMKVRESEQFDNLVSLPGQEQKISVPTWDFNVVFQLSHIYRHVIQDGIGLRQMIDYYFLLKSNTNRPNDTNYNDTLQYLGLMEIAGAVMWVLKEVLGLDDQYLIAPVDERRGRFLYREIMRGGNFGKHDSTRNPKSQIGRNIERLKQDIRLLKYFPSECLWEPVFRVYHCFWRLCH